MSNSPGGGRESPSSTASSNTASGSGSVIGSVGSGSNGCRNSGASFDSGRATSTTFQGERYSAGGLSSESSLGSFRHSYHSSSSSLGSIPSEEIRNFDVAAMISQGVPDHEILNAWLTGIHLECYYQNFIQAGYDMHTISRMTPEDLNAIGVTKPHHRKKIKAEISILNISEGLPDWIPDSVDEWLRLLKLDEYLPRLLDQGYRNVRQVTNITWEDLDDIGILKLGHQKKFMLAIKRIQDIVTGKRVPAAYVPNAYTTSVDSFQLSNQPHLRHLTSSLPYPHQPQQGNSPPIPPPQVNNSQELSQYQSGAIDPRHQIVRNNVWSHHHQSIPFQQQTPSLVSTTPIGTSHQIQVHPPPLPIQQQQLSSSFSQMSEGSTVTNSNHHNQAAGVQTLYHPEVISIRVKNGPNNSLDSPPEEEPIYGTSSFLPPPNGLNPAQQFHNNNTSYRSGGANVKSLEDGEQTFSPTSAVDYSSNNLYMTKQSMSNTWTLPRLQKHKPISKVMGGGDRNNSFDSSSSSVTYPINPGPFAPQKFNQPITEPSPISTFSKCEYATVKSQPPPPPRRSSCSSLGPSPSEDDLPLPPPPLEELSRSRIPNVRLNMTETQKMYGIANNHNTQQRVGTLPTYSVNKMSNGSSTSCGGRRSTLPVTNSRDPSPKGSDPSDQDLHNNGGFLCKGVRRNGSDASLTSSTESESIPFANDNAGTIKQQKPAQQKSTSHPGGNELIQHDEAGDVLSDIGSMLADLTDQLDAILEQERTSKR